MEEQRSIRRIFFEYFVTGLLSLIAVGAAMHLPSADPGTPLVYDGDGLLHQLWIKNLVETGWYRVSERFGASGGCDLNEFPSADLLHYAIIWPISKVFPNSTDLYNIYFLLGVVLAAWTMLFAARNLGVGFLPALSASVLFACLPYHFLRMAHFFLASYWPVPLGCLLAIRLYLGRPMSFAATLAVGIVLGLGGIYYAFFTCYFAFMAGLSGSVTQRSWKPLLRASIPVAAITFTLLAALAPAIAHKRSMPFNPDAIYRLPAESEVLGLKMMHLVMPVQGHRIRMFREFRNAYDERTPINNENATAALGLAGAVGFGYLLLRFLLLRRRQWRQEAEPNRENPLLDALGFMTAAGFLLGTVSGFGAFFAFFVSPWIRGYNRISIFIGMFALLGLAALLHGKLQAQWDRPRRRWAASIGLLVFTSAAIWEQDCGRMMPKHEVNRDRNRSDEEFVRRIEAQIEPGKLVYQMPYRPFPEASGEPPGIAFYCYDLLRPELHSKTLSWSYGAPRGRYGDTWVRRMEAKTLEERLNALADADCGGVMIFREAYRDGAAEIERYLKNRLKTSPIVSGDQRMSFFPLEHLVVERSQTLELEDWEKAHLQEKYPVLGIWGLGAGLRNDETDEGGSRFCFSGSELRLVNPTGQTRKIRLRMDLRLSKPHADAYLTLRDGEGNPRFPITDLLTTFEQDYTVPPGSKLIRVDCASDKPHHFEVFQVECVDQ